MEEIVFPKRYMVTSALPYANGPLHLGHLAGAYLSADAYVRFLRLMGKDVLYVCGSDEYGAAISIKARKEGVTPKEIVDKYHLDRKSTRLNSSHVASSYAGFCLKKKRRC